MRQFNQGVKLRYIEERDAEQIAAIIGILALMAYMLLAPNHSYTPRHAGRPAGPTGAGGGTTVDAAGGWTA